MAESRSRRTRLAIGGDGTTTGPTVRSQPAAHEVPLSRTNPSSGLEGLDRAFSSFFGGLGNAVETFSNAEQLVQKEKIQQENEQEKLKGVADAELGKEVNGSLSNDMDYLTAYKKTAGEKAGNALFTDFYEKVYTNLGPGDDIQARANEFLKAEVGNGTGDPTFDAHAAATFSARLKPAIQKHVENSVKAQIDMGKLNLQTVIGDAVKAGDVTPENIADWTAKARALDPMDVKGAPQAVISGILAAVKDNPKAAAAVQATLHQPGTGINGRSFMDSFPEMSAEMDAKLVADYRSANTMTALRAGEALHDQLRKAQTVEDYGKVIVAAEEYRDRYGDNGVAASIMDKAVNETDKFAKKEAEYQTVKRGVDAGIRDVSGINKHQRRLLQDETGVADPLADPAATAHALTRHNTISPDLKADFTAALGDFSNPQRQAQAFALYRAIQSEAGDDENAALRFMDEKTKHLYLVAEAQASLSGEDPLAIFQRLKENMPAVNKARTISWAEVTGKKPEDAETAVRDRITTSFNTVLERNGWLTGIARKNVQIDPVAMDDLLDAVKYNAVTYGQIGGGWEDAVENTVKGTMDRVEVIPGVGSTLMVRPRRMAPDDPETKQKTVPFGFNVPNPHNGNLPEDTIETFRMDRQAASAAIPGIMPDGSKVTVFPRFPELGAYSVQSNGRDVSVAPGQKVTFNVADGAAGPDGSLPTTKPETVTVPSDPGEAVAFLNQRLGRNPRFHFVPFPDPQKPAVFVLAYKPGFTQRAKTIDEMERDFRARPTPATVSSDTVGTGFDGATQ